MSESVSQVQMRTSGFKSPAAKTIESVLGCKTKSSERDVPVQRSASVLQTVDMSC